MNWPREQIQILSIGCTATPLNVDRARSNNVGMAYWGANSSEVFLTAQSTSALAMADVLLGGSERIYRINPIVPPGRYDLANTNEIDSLIGLGETSARNALSKLEEAFFKLPAIPFKPYNG